MNGHFRLQMRPAVVALGALALIGASATVTYLAMKESASTAPVAVGTAPAGSSPQSGTRPTNEVTVTLSPDAVKRAGIELQQVSASTATGVIRVPGTVQANAYRTTVVTSIAGGRISRVSAELGQSVRRGQTLAEVYSAELAEAQTRFIASRAELDAHERELQRTEKLVEIGAASRQELERIHAEHTAATTMVQSQRTRLTLLGMTEAQVAKLGPGSTIAASVSIPSPLDGVVTTREANTGMNIEPSAPLFTVADLSSVWVVGNLNERDLGQVRVGSPATVTTGLAGLAREGKVSYIDPQINVATRTAQLRVEIANPGGQLRLGMYVDMEVRQGGTQTAVMVPRSAVQIVGDRSVVYVANLAQTGQFTERVVEVGNTTIDDSVSILSGLKVGETIVTKASFAIRSEAERLGVRSSSPGGPAAAAPHAVQIVVSEKGFEPARVTLRAGVPARLTFVRTTDATCATEVAIPSLNIMRDLPLNQAVEIAFTPEKPGDVAFACGMAMFSGTLVSTLR